MGQYFLFVVSPDFFFGGFFSGCSLSHIFLFAIAGERVCAGERRRFRPFLRGMGSENAGSETGRNVWDEFCGREQLGYSFQIAYLCATEGTVFEVTTGCLFVGWREATERVNAEFVCGVAVLGGIPAHLSGLSEDPAGSK